MIEQCQRPGASIASVALANGLNANMVRNWLVGRGLKRSGLEQSTLQQGEQTATAGDGGPPPASARARDVQFVPIRLAAPSRDRAEVADTSEDAQVSVAASEPISIELRSGAVQLVIRWPVAQAQQCVGWLREVATVLK